MEPCFQYFTLKMHRVPALSAHAHDANTETPMMNDDAPPPRTRLECASLQSHFTASVRDLGRLSSLE